MNQKKQLAVILILLTLVLGLFTVAYLRTARPEDTEPIQASSFQLNTVITITLYDSQDEELLDKAMALCGKYEQLFSRTRKDSEIYQLNHRTLPQNPDGSYTVSPETADLIATGLHYASLSKGAFDITIAPVSSLWDFTSDEKKIPTQQELNEALPDVGYEKVTVDGTSVTLAEGTALDLGAIAKGFIADQIKAFLLENGVRSATINLGGNVLCIGSKPDGTPFRVGVQKPFADRNETLAILESTDSSVVSSGTYERCFEKDGVFYHHILNPRTGLPYDNGLTSVTILSEASADGDALSTACFALGPKDGMALLNSLEDIEGFFVTDEGELLYSDGFPLTASENTELPR